MTVRFGEHSAWQLDADPERNREKIEHTMRMVASLVDNDAFEGGLLAPGFDSSPNPNIPAGYTYLGQLAAHDLIQTSIQSAGPAHEHLIRNNRDSRLDLDTLYGAGPTACPHAYAGEGRTSFRKKLRLGRMRGEQRLGRRTPAGVFDCAALSALGLPLRDIARGRACVVNDEESGGLTEAFIADPRNDDNAILSQLLTVFIHFHNFVVDNIDVQVGVAGHSNPGGGEHERNFLRARAVVEFVYRRILRQDYLRRILHPDLFDHYVNNDGVFADRGDSRLPVEFSHGAFRFGHAMVRRSYDFNRQPKLDANGNPTGALRNIFSVAQVLNQTSQDSPGQMPLDHTWIVDWSKFFETDPGRPPMFSRRIGPKYSGKLAVGSETVPNAENLALRDFKRARGLALWSVPALIDRIHAEVPGLLPARHFENCKEAMASWIGDARPQSIISEDGKNAVINDPPLSLFVLVEAAVQTDGTSLGSLGSVIVAETMLPRLPANEPWPLMPPRPGSLMAQIADIQDMPSLIEFLGTNIDLGESEAPFF